MGSLILGNEIGHPSSEQGPGHIGEGEEEQTASPKGVDCPDGRPGEDEVDEAKTEGCEERDNIGGTGVAKNSGGVERHDVNCVYVSLASRIENVLHLLPHICWANITTPEA